MIESIANVTRPCSSITEPGAVTTGRRGATQLRYYNDASAFKSFSSYLVLFRWAGAGRYRSRFCKQLFFRNDVPQSRADYNASLPSPKTFS
ncbi:MAG: hypothetical protein ACR2G5_05360 [Pyrinomonadaceae bacterium]